MEADGRQVSEYTTSRRRVELTMRHEAVRLIELIHRLALMPRLTE